MNKAQKLRKMIGAVVGFRVDTPESNEGELTQYVVATIKNVFRAECNGETYVRAYNWKRFDGKQSPLRQYKVNRIHDRSIKVLHHNKWTKKEKIKAYGGPDFRTGAIIAL